MKAWRPAAGQKQASGTPLLPYAATGTILCTMSSIFNRRFPVRAALCSLALASLLTGCGPKDIGAGSSGDAAATAQGVAAEDQLRYPIMGSSRTQQLLYMQNRPDVMANTQQWRLQQFNRAHGLDRDQNPEHPEYRGFPKQRSPFKQ